MKKTLIFLLLFHLSLQGKAQFGKVLNRMGESAQNTVENKTNSKVSEKIENGIEGLFKRKEKNQSPNSSDSQSVAMGKDMSQKNLKSYSKFDFVPGEKIIYAEDFTADLVGEMPVNWITNGKGELMELDGLEGKWLRGFKNSELISINSSELGENYTIEFDLIYYFQPDEAVYVMPDLRISILNNYPKSKTGNPKNGESSFTLNIHPKEEKSLAWVTTYLDAPTFTSDKMEVPFFSSKYNQVQHVAIQVQKSRLRIWMDEKKVVDMPQVIDLTRKMARIGFELGGTSYRDDEVGYFVSNIKFANGLADTRHKLMTEGKFSTTGILFAHNSAEIQPNSYGVIKEIAQVLKDNSTVRIKILGHTSSDGNPQSNKLLSAKRAQAVKEFLINEFRIDGKRIEIEGVGDTQPVAPNSTNEGRVQNRRVEFWKLS